MNSTEELAIVIANSATSWAKYGDRYEDAANAIIAAGYAKVPLAEIQEQVNHMYAAAKQGENMFGENTASDHLRHFADKIGALITTGVAA